MSRRVHRRVLSRAMKGAGAAVCALVVSAAPRAVLACPVCYGNADAPIIDGARAGTLVLLGFVLFLQISFGSFFLYLNRRAKAIRALQFESQKGSLVHHEMG